MVKCSKRTVNKINVQVISMENYISLNRKTKDPDIRIPINTAGKYF
jgi:hypothetical protein